MKPNQTVFGFSPRAAYFLFRVSEKRNKLSVKEEGYYMIGLMKKN